MDHPAADHGTDTKRGEHAERGECVQEGVDAAAPVPKSRRIGWDGMEFFDRVMSLSGISYMTSATPGAELSVATHPSPLLS